MRLTVDSRSLLLAGCLLGLQPLVVCGQVVAIYRGTAERAAGADKPAMTTTAELAFRSLDPGVLDGSAGLELLGETGNFVGRLDGRVLAVVSRTKTHHLAWTGRIDPGTGELVGAIRAIPLGGGSVEAWTYSLAPVEAADGVVTELRVDSANRPATASDTATSSTATTPATAAARSSQPPPLVGEWEFYTYIDDLPQTRSLYIESVRGTLFVFRLGTYDAPEESGTYDPANGELSFISGGYTYSASLKRNRKGEWQLIGRMRRGTASVADATDSRGSVRGTRKGDLPPELTRAKTP